MTSAVTSAPTLTADQMILVATVADRERTPAELAAYLKRPAGEIDRQMRGLRKLGLIEARMDKCPLCEHVFGGRVYSATTDGLLVVAGSPLLRRATRA